MKKGTPSITDIFSPEQIDIIITNTQERIKAIKLLAQEEYSIMMEAKKFLDEATKDFETKRDIYNAKTAEAVSQEKFLDEIVKMKDGEHAVVYSKLDNTTTKRKGKYNISGIKWRDEAEAILRHKKNFIAPKELYKLILAKHPNAVLSKNHIYTTVNDFMKIGKDPNKTQLTINEKDEIGLGQWMNHKGELTREFLIQSVNHR